MAMCDIDPSAARADPVAFAVGLLTPADFRDAGGFLQRKGRMGMRMAGEGILWGGPILWLKVLSLRQSLILKDQ